MHLSLMTDGSRALEFFMIHIMASCLFAGPGLQIYGTPLRFHIFDYMDQPVATRTLCADIHQDLAPLKISWEDRTRVITNEVLRRQGLNIEGL